MEVQNYVILAKDLGYLSEEQYEGLKIKVFNGYKVLNGLIRSTIKLSQ